MDGDLRLTTSDASKELGDQVSNGSLSPIHSAKDEELLGCLVQLRMLSIDQIQRLLFANQHQSLISRALKRLRAPGWVTVWDEPLGRGGRRRYVLPTAAGTRQGIAVLRNRVANSPVERLVASMLPAYARRPLELDRRGVPAFLPHQRECNHLAISFVRAGIASWTSTWDRPFQPVIGGVAMPQPDAVLVLRLPVGPPKLVFLEHDRGQESRAHFERAKIERYVQLARLPRFCVDLFGFREFVVAVTVADMVKRRPLDRLKALSHFTSERGASPLFVFTLAGWAHAQPLGAIWFADGTVPHGRALRPEAYSSLRSLSDTPAAMPPCQDESVVSSSRSELHADDLASQTNTSHMPTPPPSRFNDGAQHERETIHNPDA